MDAAQPCPPLTAYEALKGIFPDHRGHTVLRVRYAVPHVEMYCNCVPEPLEVTDKMLAVFDWSLKDLKNALRNVPSVK